MMSNRIRGRFGEDGVLPSINWLIPKGYCETLSVENDFKANVALWNITVEGVALNISGEATVKLLPVPYAGTWEIRTGSVNPGIYHYYFGSDAHKSNMQDLGVWRREYKPAYSIENDSLIFFDLEREQKLHKRLSGPNSYMSVLTENQKTLRQVSSRIIIGRFYMEPSKDYYLCVRPMVLFDSKEWKLGYIEMIPSSVYDNPDRAEDTW